MGFKMAILAQTFFEALYLTHEKSKMAVIGSQNGQEFGKGSIPRFLDSLNIFGYRHFSFEESFYEKH